MGTGDRLLDIPCKVCGDRSSGKHYGIYSCDGTCDFKNGYFREEKAVSLLKVFIMQDAPGFLSGAFIATVCTPVKHKATSKGAALLTKHTETSAVRVDFESASRRP